MRALVRARPDGNRDRGQQREDGKRDVFDARAGAKEHPECGEHHEARRAHVGLEQNRYGDQRGHEQRRNDAAHERAHVGADRRELRCEEEHERELRDLGGLEAQHARAEPTPRRLQTDVRNQHVEQQHGDADEAQAKCA